jgi:hypothetical protein
MNAKTILSHIFLNCSALTLMLNCYKIEREGTPLLFCVLPIFCAFVMGYDLAYILLTYKGESK